MSLPHVFSLHFTVHHLNWGGGGKKKGTLLVASSKPCYIIHNDRGIDQQLEQGSQSQETWPAVLTRQ